MSTFKDLPNVPRAATILRRFKDRVYVHAREFGFQDTIECSGMIATNGGIVDDVVTDESSHFVVAKVRPRSGRITLTDGIPSLITRSKKAMMLAVCRIEFANGLQWIPDPTMNLPIPTTQEDIRQEADGQTPRPPIAIRMKLFPPRFSKLIVGEMGYVGDLRGTLVDTMADSGRTGRSMQDLVEGQMGDNGKGGTGDGVSIDDSHITQHPSKQLKRQIPETPAPPLPQPEQATETLTSTKTGATSVETLLDVDLPPASPISIYQPPLGQSTVPSPFLAATKPLAHPPVLTRTRPDPAQSMTASFGPLSVRPILHFPFRPSLPIGKAGSLPPINPAPAGTRFTTPSLPPPVGRNMHAESLSAYGLVGGSSKTASAGLAVPIRLAPMLDPALKVVGLAGMWMASGAAHDASLGGGSMGGRSGAREKRLADDTGSGTAPASKR